MCCMELALKATLRISQADKPQWEGKSCSYLPKVSGCHYPDDMAGRMHCCTGHPVGFCSVWFLAFLVLFTENQLTWQEVLLFLAAYALRVTWSVRKLRQARLNYVTKNTLTVKIWQDAEQGLGIPATYYCTTDWYLQSIHWTFLQNLDKFRS